MEAIQQRGGARLLGVSNVTVEQLQSLCRQARIQPRFVQNRCRATQGWDRSARRFCNDHGIVYQGFSLLTANREALSRPAIREIAQAYGRPIPQIVFRFAIEVGMIPLTGTSSADHMRMDLGSLDFELKGEDVDRIETIIT